MIHSDRKPRSRAKTLGSRSDAEYISQADGAVLAEEPEENPIAVLRLPDQLPSSRKTRRRWASVELLGSRRLTPCDPKRIPRHEQVVPGVWALSSRTRAAAAS